MLGCAVRALPRHLPRRHVRVPRDRRRRLRAAAAAGRAGLHVRYVDKVFDAVLETGARPFVELGFMPRDAGHADRDGVLVEGALQPAEGHGALGRAGHRHGASTGSSGTASTRSAQWRFEVWNEPNLVPALLDRDPHAVLRAVRGDGAGDQGHRRRSCKVGGPSTSVFVPDARYAGEYEDRSAEDRHGGGDATPTRSTGARSGSTSSSTGARRATSRSTSCRPTCTRRTTRSVPTARADPSSGTSTRPTTTSS